MSLLFLTEPSLDLAVASALSNCQSPTMQDDDSGVLLTCSTFLPLPMKDCVLEVPPSLLSCVPLEPITLLDAWESPAIDVEDLEDLSSVAIAPAEFAVPACAFWSPKFDFECHQFDDVSTCASSSPSSDDSSDESSDDSSDDSQENLLTDRKVVWWRWSESGGASARSTSSTASTAVPRSNSNSSISSSSTAVPRSNSSSSISSSSTSPRIGHGTSRSKRFLHKAKDLFCEMVAFDEKCSNSPEIHCTNDLVARPIVTPLQSLNGRMPRFPSCELGSPRSRVLSQTKSVDGPCNANALTGVGACANSVLAVSPVGSSKIKFCKLLQEAVIGEELTIQQSASVKLPACKSCLPLVSAHCSHYPITGV